MIDYKKHRDRLKRGSLKVIEPGEDYGKQWLHDAQRAQQELFEDVEVILDKAEKWDKVNEGLTVDGIHTSPGLLKELFELREKVEKYEK